MGRIARPGAALCGNAEIVPEKNADKAQKDATDSQTRLFIAWSFAQPPARLELTV